MRRKCGSGSAPANCWHARPSHPGTRGVVRLLVRTLGAWAVRAAMRCPARERGRGADDVRDGSGGGIALGGESGGRLRAGTAATDAPGGFVLRANGGGAV